MEGTTKSPRWDPEGAEHSTVSEPAAGEGGVLQ